MGPTKCVFSIAKLRWSLSLSKSRSKSRFFDSKIFLFQIIIYQLRWHENILGVSETTYKSILNHLEWFKTILKKIDFSLWKHFFEGILKQFLAAVLLVLLILENMQNSCDDSWTSKPYLYKRSGEKLRIYIYFVLAKGIVLTTYHFSN